MTFPLANLSDVELLRRLGGSSLAAAAFDELYDRHAADLLAFARCRFSHIADDLCQTAWLEAIQRHWEPGDTVRAWLFRVVSNRGVSDFRKTRKGSAPLPPDVPSGDEDVDAPLLNRERAERVRHCQGELRQQKPEWSEVIEAWLAGELPDEAANRLGITRDNYYQRKKRALDALARCIDPVKETNP